MQTEILTDLLYLFSVFKKKKKSIYFLFIKSITKAEVDFQILNLFDDVLSFFCTQFPRSVQNPLWVTYHTCTYQKSVSVIKNYKPKKQFLIRERMWKINKAEREKVNGHKSKV